MSLQLPPLGAAPGTRSWLSYVRPAFDLRLRENTAEEVRDMAAAQEELVRRFGQPRVLQFFERELLAAARRLPPGRPAQLARLEVGCRVLALHTELAPGPAAVALAAALAGELAGVARLDDDLGENLRQRREVRVFLAAQVGRLAVRLTERGPAGAAAAQAAYTLLERLGALAPAERAGYARLLWRTGERGAGALAVYLRRLGDRGDRPADPELAAMAGFVRQQLAVDEELSRDELARRLQLNQLALCAPAPPAEAALHAGLAYLLLDQPDRALGYLRQAAERNGAAAGGSGAAAFYLGRALFGTGSFAAAAAAFEQAGAQGYPGAQIASWLGVAHAKAGRWEQARATFDEAESALGTIRDPEFFLQWGRACFLTGEPEQAERRLLKALDIFPWPLGHRELSPDQARLGARIACSLATCRVRLGRRAEAQADLRPWAAGAHAFAPAAHLLGTLLLEDEEEQGREEALACLRRALELRPDDAEYALSLGLALTEPAAHDAAEGLQLLEQAARAGVGGPEVVRRLVTGTLQAGERQRARRWLGELARLAPGSAAVALLAARDMASRATVAINAGRYGEAAALWQEAAPTLGPGPAAERLGLALLCDAAARLQAGESAGLWEQVERARGLHPSFEAQLLSGVGLLARGEAAAASERFAALAAERPERTEAAALATLAAGCAGAEGTAERLQGLAPESAGPLLALVAVLAALRRGDGEAAAAAVDAWVAEPAAVAGVGVERHQVELLVALVKLGGARRKRQRVARALEDLAVRDGAGAWDLALAVVRHHLAAAPGAARAEEADPAQLAACEAAYRELLGRAPAAARPALLACSADLLQFRVCHAVLAGDLGGALEVLERWKELAGELPRAAAKLRAAVAARLSKPSHEKAFALLDRDPDEARKVWKALLQRHPDDHLALHHLACLAWTRAYDGLLAGRAEAALPYWKEGLELFRQLYGREDFWRALEAKGRVLGETAAHPFDERAFAAWRESAVDGVARTLVELVFHLLAGVDPAKRGEGIDAPLKVARSLVSLLRDAKLAPELKERLADALADHYLDPDPTRVPDFAAAARRAELVVDLDPHNLKARAFLVRGATFDTDTRRKEGERDYVRLAGRLTAVERHAEWLAARLDQLSGEPRGRLAADLAAFYDQKGQVKHEEADQVTGRFNALPEGQVRQAKMLLTAIRQCHQESDTALKRALAFDPVNARAQEMLDHHAGEYGKIDRILGQLRHV